MLNYDKILSHYVFCEITGQENYDAYSEILEPVHGQYCVEKKTWQTTNKKNGGGGVLGRLGHFQQLK